MAGKNDPKVQNAVAPQQVSDLATPHTDGEPSYREQFRQAAAEAIKAATPAHQHDKSAIAENHERLQNAGMENAATSVNPTVVSRTTSTATTSSKRTEQAFEDQRSSDQILTTKSRRGRKERRFIPDSIQSLVDVLENSLSESQIQEVLEQAIEDRAQGSALQISQSELKEATEAIFEQVRLAL
ncbi:MAG: hypothetical protein KDD70_17210, partial [Bdellovibrionales bacterium]|nr:hypothetical protein [Bdellovibrionales bacterium]